MWTTEAWMPYPPTGEITGSQPRVGCRHVTCRTVRVWWWNFPEKPASQNHWLCLGGIFRDGSRPRATCEMITWGLTYISSAWFGVREFPPTWTFFFSGLKVWCVKCPRDIIMQNKGFFWFSRTEYRSMLYRVLQRKLQRKIVCQQVERKIVCQKVWMDAFWKQRCQPEVWGVSSQTFLLRLCQTKHCIRGGSFSMIFTFSRKSILCRKGHCGPSASEMHEMRIQRHGGHLAIHHYPDWSSPIIVFFSGRQGKNLDSYCMRFNMRERTISYNPVF